MFFFKRKSVARLVKAYFFVDLQAPIDFAFFCRDVIPLAGGRNLRYEWNHGRPRGYDAGKFTSFNIPNSRLNVLKITDEKGAPVFLVARWPLSDQARPGMFELIIKMEGPADVDGTVREARLFEQLCSRAELVYGYSRNLRSDHDPIRETGTHDRYGKSLLVVNTINTWMFHPGELAAGGVRAVYPFNFWSAAVAQRLRDKGVVLPYKALHGLVEFSREEQAQIVRDNPDWLRFLRFGPTG